MAISLFGTAKDPSSDNSANAGPTAVIVPPSNMIANDYVVVFAAYRGTTETVAVGTTGGQSWTTETQVNQGNIRSRIFHCRYNGTWSANPDFTVTTGTSAIIGYMSVWRGVHEASAIDVTPTGIGYAAPATPFDVARASSTTNTTNAVPIYIWFSTDNNTWALQAGGPTLTQPEAQWRVTTTIGLSISIGYLTQAAIGDPGSKTNRQATLGGDEGATHYMALREGILDVHPVYPSIILGPLDMEASGPGFPSKPE